MLGAFLLMRRTMLDEIGGWDAGYRHYCEDIDLCYRAAQAGWERWYVPDARRDARVRGRHRPAVPLATHALARARDGAVRAQAPRAPAGAVTDKERPVRAPGGRLDGARLRRRLGVPRASRRADRRRSGRALEAGDEVLDLACGDGGLGEALLARGLRYRGVDSTPEMVEAARERLGRACDRRARRPQRLRAAEPGGRDDGLPRDLLRARPPRVLRARRRVHARRSSSSTSTRGSTGSTTCVADLRAAGFGAIALRPFFVPQTVSLPRPAARRAPRRSSAAARSRASRSARASRISSRRRASRRRAAGSPRARRPRRAARRSLFDGSISVGTNVGATVISMRHGTFGRAERRRRSPRSRGRRTSRVSVTRSISRLLVRPDPDRSDAHGRLARSCERSDPGTSRCA